MIADSINRIANKEIYFNADEIKNSSEEISSAIVGELVGWACKPQNIMPISIARDCLKQFPVEWVSSKMKQTALKSIDITDDWDYRRLLELSEMISLDLLKWAITLGEKSDNSDILEAADDYNERLQAMKCHNCQKIVPIDGFGGYQHYQSIKKAMEHHVATGFFQMMEGNQYETIYQCKECHTKWVLAAPDFPIVGYLKQA